MGFYIEHYCGTCHRHKPAPGMKMQKRENGKGSYWQCGKCREDTKPPTLPKKQVIDREE